MPESEQALAAERCLIGLGGSRQAAKGGVEQLGYNNSAQGGQEWGLVHPVVSRGASDGRQRGIGSVRLLLFLFPLQFSGPCPIKIYIELLWCSGLVWALLPLRCLNGLVPRQLRFYPPLGCARLIPLSQFSEKLHLLF